MFRLDIESMYPSIPTNNEVLEVIKNFLIKYKDDKELYGVTINHIIKFIGYIFKYN